MAPRAVHGSLAVLAASQVVCCSGRQVGRRVDHDAGADGLDSGVARRGEGLHYFARSRLERDRTGAGLHGFAEGMPRFQSGGKVLLRAAGKKSNRRRRDRVPLGRDAESA